MTYAAPLSDMRFVLEQLCAIGDTAGLPGLEEATPDLVDAVLEEASRLTSEVLAPLNKGGDLQGSRLVDGAVRTPDGWKEAYTQFVEGGWNGAAFGGQRRTSRNDSCGKHVVWLVPFAQSGRD